MDEITAAKINELQTNIDLILGIGAGDKGYGQQVRSFQVNRSDNTNNTILASHLNQMYDDLKVIRTHQIGVSEILIDKVTSNLNLVGKDDSNFITDGGDLEIDPDSETKGILDYETLINLVVSDRFLIHETQGSLENGITSTRYRSWNGTIYHEVSATFTNSNHRRHFFNSGGDIRFDANITGASSAKGIRWAQLCNDSKTIIFNHGFTTSEGSQEGIPTDIGFFDLTTTYQLIFSNTITTGNYVNNKYAIYAKLYDTNSVYFKIEFSDVVEEEFDANVDGVITSTVRQYRATGEVTVPSPAYRNVASLDSFEEPQTYKLIPSSTRVREGQTFTIVLRTSGVPNLTPIPYTITGISTSDIQSPLSGSFVIEQEYDSIDIKVSNDLEVEDDETLTLTLTNNKASVSVVLENTTEPPTYNISPDKTAISEGDTVTFTITTTNIVNNTVLYWTDIGTSEAADFDDGVISGTVVIVNNTGSVSRKVKNDLTTDGSETCILELRSGSFSGEVLAVSPDVVINDTSLTIPPPEINVSWSTTVGVVGTAVTLSWDTNESTTVVRYAITNSASNPTSWTRANTVNGSTLWTPPESGRWYGHAIAYNSKDETQQRYATINIQNQAAGLPTIAVYWTDGAVEVGDAAIFNWSTTNAVSVRYGFVFNTSSEPTSWTPTTVVNGSASYNTTTEGTIWGWAEATNADGVTIKANSGIYASEEPVIITPPPSPPPSPSPPPPDVINWYVRASRDTISQGGSYTVRWGVENHTSRNTSVSNRFFRFVAATNDAVYISDYTTDPSMENGNYLDQSIDTDSSGNGYIDVEVSVSSTAEIGKTIGFSCVDQTGPITDDLDTTEIVGSGNPPPPANPYYELSVGTNKYFNEGNTITFSATHRNNPHANLYLLIEANSSNHAYPSKYPIATYQSSEWPSKMQTLGIWQNGKSTTPVEGFASQTFTWWYYGDVSTTGRLYGAVDNATRVYVNNTEVAAFGDFTAWNDLGSVVLPAGWNYVKVVAGNLPVNGDNGAVSSSNPAAVGLEFIHSGSVAWTTRSDRNLLYPHIFSEATFEKTFPQSEVKVNQSTSAVATTTLTARSDEVPEGRITLTAYLVTIEGDKNSQVATETFYITG